MEKPVIGWMIFQEAPSFLEGSAVQLFSSSSISFRCFESIGTSLWIEHFAHNVSECLFGDGAEERVARDLPSMEVNASEP